MIDTLTNIAYWLFQTGALLAYVFLSLILVFRQRLKRWLAFTIGYAALFLLVSHVLFDRLPSISVAVPSLPAIPLYTMLFLASAVIVALALWREWTVDQLLAALLLLCALILAFLVIAYHARVPSPNPHQHGRFHGFHEELKEERRKKENRVVWRATRVKDGDGLWGAA